MSALLDPFALEAQLADVRAEREAQDAKWGEQNHPDGTGPDTFPLMHLDGVQNAAELRDAAREWTDVRSAFHLVSYRDVLLEEVLEALAEDDPTGLRRELIQVAAVALGWVGAIDRRGRPTGMTPAPETHGDARAEAS